MNEHSIIFYVIMILLLIMKTVLSLYDFIVLETIFGFNRLLQCNI